MAIAGTRDISIFGPVNGMNEPDPAGSYLRLVLTKGEIREERRISLGAADVLAAELTGILASAPAPSDPAGAGGDLGRIPEPYRAKVAQVLAFTGEDWIMLKHYFPAEIEQFRRVLSDRSGQIVASTPGQKGAGEEKTGAPAPGVQWSAWSEIDADSDPSDPGVTYCTEWFVGRWPFGAEDPDCRILIGTSRSAEIIARRVAERLTSILNTDVIRAQTPLSPPSATPERDHPMTVDGASPCHWGGGNDIIWCSTCGAEYAYAKGEERPACPRTLHAAGEVRHG